MEDKGVKRYRNDEDSKENCRQQLVGRKENEGGLDEMREEKSGEDVKAAAREGI